jgi:hypothetical protein
MSTEPAGSQYRAVLGTASTMPDKIMYNASKEQENKYSYHSRCTAQGQRQSRAQEIPVIGHHQQKN